MKKLFPISIYWMLFSLISISWLPPTNVEEPGTKYLPAKSPTKSESEILHLQASLMYDNLCLEDRGLSIDAFVYAYKGYKRLLKKKVIKETGYLTICDFSQSSGKKRLYIIDLCNEQLVMNTYVAHGRNSGGEYAARFSNKPSSLQSSLGFFVTQNTYFGEHGLSLRIAGLEAGYNDKALRRGIVVHGADYIEETWLKKKSEVMGRSYGCPAVPEKECSLIINTIKNGTCLFIYHPSRAYLKASKILNY
ncbi:MAG: murein L,D-transpeptidase catalytic domain family protein [Chitinophagaceae bacterium]